MIEKIPSHYPDDLFYCSKCGSKLEHGEIHITPHDFNRYTGNKEYHVATEYRCPNWKRFRGHIKAWATLFQNETGYWWEFMGGW